MRHIKMMILALGFFLCANVTVVHAGIFQFVKDNFVLSASTIIGLIFLVIASVFGKKYLKYKQPIVELYDVVEAYQEARKEKSDMGRKISPKEQEKILNEIIEAGKAIFKIVPIRWLRR